MGRSLRSEQCEKRYRRFWIVFFASLLPQAVLGAVLFLGAVLRLNVHPLAECLLSFYRLFIPFAEWLANTLGMPSGGLDGLASFAFVVFVTPFTGAVLYSFVVAYLVYFVTVMSGGGQR